MSITANQASLDVLRRVRDPNQLATTQTFVIDLLSRCQIIINAVTKSVLTSATLNTNKLRSFYSLFTDIPTVFRVLFVRDDEKELTPTTLTEMNDYKQDWFRDVKESHDTYFSVGRDLFVVYPAKPFDSTVTVIGTKVTDTLSLPTDTFELQDSDVPLALDLTEMLLLLKARKFDTLQPLLDKLSDRMKERMHLAPGKSTKEQKDTEPEVQ